jgi:GR25 family glycosyltransferase involved in LPS biosynthesis
MDINYLKNYDGDITVKLVEETDYLFDQVRQGKKVIGTYDYNRVPVNNEIIIIIGDYPVSKDSLVISNPMRRNYLWALNFKYDDFEGNKCWDKIEIINIINDIDRPDRLFDILKEFKKMGIPLNKVYRQDAIKDLSTTNSYVNGLVGCFKSHLSILNRFHNTEFENIAIFEDDFTFSEPIEENQNSLIKFFDGYYEHEVLLLATSAEGVLVKRDDLVSNSYQSCTTTSGYILSKKGLERILPMWEKANNMLISTYNFNVYACDRYWSLIQGDNSMFSFNRKLGYQRPSFSQTSKTLAYNLD